MLKSNSRTYVVTHMQIIQLAVQVSAVQVSAEAWQ